jgi:RNA polymerase sigma factor (TIGR02999 family)
MPGNQAVLGNDSMVWHGSEDTVEAARTEVTRLLLAWSAGDERALECLTPMVYQELHRVAAAYTAHERPDHTLQATALVHETYLRLVDLRGDGWRDRTHFFAVAPRMMRRILVDFARARTYQKRDGGERISLEGALVLAEQPCAELVTLDDALNRLAAIDERKSQVVELRYFGGLQVEETSEALKISPETVMREWRAAKAWLYLHLAGGQHGA